MKKLSSYVIKYLWLYIIAIVAMIISVSLDMISPMISLHIVDDVILGRQIELLRNLLIGIAIVGIGRVICQYVKEYIFDYVSVTISAKLRRDLFQYIQKLDTSFFDKTNTGEIMARLKEDIDKIWSALCFVSMLLIEVFIHTVIVLYCMFTLNWKLTIIPVIAMTISATIAYLLESELGKVYEAISEENAVLNTIAEENLTGVRTVKAFAREKHEIAKFLKHNQTYCELNIKQSKVFVKYYPYFSLITKVLPMLVILYGGYLYIQGELTLGSLTAFVAYSMNIVWPMEMLGWLTNDFSSALASNKKIRKIYEQIATIKDPDVPVVLDEVKGRVTFTNVGFHKEDGHKILDGINFNIEPGKTLGVMGATGAGKSSIISLLTRLYDATDGDILLDGVNVKDLTLKQLRGSISFVMQDVFLFSDTISENIKMGKRHTIGEDIVRRASQKAGASEFIEKMDKQYETVIGERGVGLSGGQKQRISIARAFSKHLPILIMDDSTSALDMETEREIQHELNELNDMTKIIIAHRISAVKNADEIIVLDNGCIAERGTHDELIQKHGLYYETYISQYGDQMLANA